MLLFVEQDVNLLMLQYQQIFSP